MTPLIFLHGWAQSRQVWFQQFDAFPEAQFLNLPGHGGAATAEPEAWCETLLAQLPEEPVTLVGWSLGGMLAMQLAAQHPERIAALALVATTPRFIIGPDWPHGSSDELFAGFRSAVDSGDARTLNRFFMLMLHGDNLVRSEYNRLARGAVDREQRPDPAGLAAGLSLLEQLDLRHTMVARPALLIHGEADAIVPAGAGQWLAETLPHSASHILPDCGHAPFLSRPEWFNTTLRTWWQQQ